MVNLAEKYGVPLDDPLKTKTAVIERADRLCDEISTFLTNLYTSGNELPGSLLIERRSLHVFKEESLTKLSIIDPSNLRRLHLGIYTGESPVENPNAQIDEIELQIDQLGREGLSGRSEISLQRQKNGFVLKYFLETDYALGTNVIFQLSNFSTAKGPEILSGLTSFWDAVTNRPVDDLEFSALRFVQIVDSLNFGVE